MPDVRGGIVGAVLAALLAAAVGVAIIAFLAGGDRISIIDLDVGDCFDLPRGEGAEVVEIDVLELVDCDGPHDAEVVAVGDLNPDGDLAYPSDEELFAAADPTCMAVDLGDDYFVVPIVPTESTWESADGRFVCVAVPFAPGADEGDA